MAIIKHKYEQTWFFSHHFWRMEKRQINQMSVYTTPLQYHSCLCCEWSTVQPGEICKSHSLLVKHCQRTFSSIHKHKKSLLLFPRPQEGRCAIVTAHKEQQWRGRVIGVQVSFPPPSTITPYTAICYLPPMTDWNQGNCTKNLLIY